MIVLRLAGDEGDGGFVQPLAGDRLWTAAAIVPGAWPATRPQGPALSDDSSAAWRVVYDGEGIDLGRPRRVVARLAPDGVREVEYDDGERFRIAADGNAVERVAAGAGGAPAALERALGAPLALALALRGVHLLHASAVVRGETVVAFTAESGVGKSTLAAAAESSGLGLRRVADDILPVRLEAASAALPHFPQLKLPAADGYPSAAPLALRFGALIELDRRPPGAADAAAPPRLERLHGAAAALSLARATVAARLFDEALLGAHLAACAAAAPALVVARLSYASGLERRAEALERAVRSLD